MGVRVLIVDDRASFRALARLVLAADGFDVVGEACDGAAGIGAARHLRPDVVLLDVQLPDLDGFGVAHTLAEDPSGPAVVLVSSRSATDYGTRVADSAARGFIAKAELSGDALHRVLAERVQTRRALSPADTPAPRGHAGGRRPPDAGSAS